MSFINGTWVGKSADREVVELLQIMEACNEGRNTGCRATQAACDRQYETSSRRLTALCLRAPQGAMATRRPDVAWVLWRDCSDKSEVIDFYADKTLADEAFALLKDISGCKYVLAKIMQFGS